MSEEWMKAAMWGLVTLALLIVLWSSWRTYRADQAKLQKLQDFRERYGVEMTQLYRWFASDECALTVLDWLDRQLVGGDLRPDGSRRLEVALHGLQAVRQAVRDSHFNDRCRGAADASCAMSAMISEELKRYDAYGNAMAPGDPESLAIFVLATDYADLEAENARLQSAFDELTERYGKLQTGEDSLLARVVTERDAARAQLAAIQGGTGEVVEVVAYLLPDYVISRRLSTHSEMKIGKPLMTVAQHERIVAALSAQLRDANNLADQWAEKNAALSSWQRTQSAPVSKAERLPLESLEPPSRPVPSGWAVKRPAIDARYVDNYLGPLEGWLEDPRRAVLFGNREAAIAVQAALSVDSLLPIFVVWLVYDEGLGNYLEKAQ